MISYTHKNFIWGPSGADLWLGRGGALALLFKTPTGESGVIVYRVVPIDSQALRQFTHSVIHSSCANYVDLVCIGVRRNDPRDSSWCLNLPHLLNFFPDNHILYMG